MVGGPGRRTMKVRGGCPRFEVLTIGRVFWKNNLRHLSPKTLTVSQLWRNLQEVVILEVQGGKFGKLD